MYMGHYHSGKGRRKWKFPTDDSHFISRTMIPDANVWTKVTAIHKVGPDWTFRGEILVPRGCNHYHIRMRVANSNADLWIDDVRIRKLAPAMAEALVVSFIYVTSSPRLLAHVNSRPPLNLVSSPRPKSPKASYPIQYFV